MTIPPRPKISERQYRDIGVFIVQYSELEDALRWTLIAALQLASDDDEGKADAIVSLFDFSALCSAVRLALRSLPVEGRASDGDVEQAIKDCMSINEDRIHVVHGTWTHVGARHVSRRSLVGHLYYKAPDDLPKLIQRAKDAMWRVMDLYITYCPPTDDAKAIS